MNYQSNKPYPRPRVEKESIHYAKLHLENYAGDISEDTAIHLYLYQYLIMNNQNQEFANAISHIAKVEMHHLRLLGETIKLLGLKPVYKTISKTNKLIPWNSLNVNYSVNLKEMLEIDIKSEEQAIEGYRRNLSMINDKYVCELITRIIEDEEIHISIFKYFYKKISNNL